MSLRILHVTPTYLPATRYGGPIYSVHGLCRSLAVLGHEVHVFTTSVDGDDDSQVPLGEPVELDGVKVWYFPSRHLRRLYWSPPMRRALAERTGQFDLVHLHSVFLWPTWAAARAARAAGVPYVLSPRGMLVKSLIRRRSFAIKSAWIGLIERSNVEHAAALHLTSERERRDLDAFAFRIERISVIPNGVDAPDPQLLNADIRTELAELLEHQPLVLYLGRISWKKGLDRLLEAWRRTKQGFLLIVGNDEEGYTPRLIEMIESLGIADRVRVLPRTVEGAEKERLLTEARLLVLPSYSENFGNVVLEAMIRETPVVVTPEVGAAEVVRESGGGVVCDGEPASLAAAIDDLLENDGKRSMMAIAGRYRVAGHYTWDQAARQMTDLYESLVYSRPLVESENA